jgi:hypothetical protein
MRAFDKPGMVPVVLATVEFAPVELMKPEELASEAFMPTTKPSSVVPAEKYREYRAAATSHEATLFSASTKK